MNNVVIKCKSVSIHFSTLFCRLLLNTDYVCVSERDVKMMPYLHNVTL